jgi:hypothetical protein
MANIQDIEANLKKQLAELTNQIRTTETSLLETKELYLKVAGALEVIDLLKVQTPDEGDLDDEISEALAI